MSLGDAGGPLFHLKALLSRLAWLAWLGLLGLLSFARLAWLGCPARLARLSRLGPWPLAPWLACLGFGFALLCLCFGRGFGLALPCFALSWLWLGFALLALAFALPWLCLGFALAWPCLGLGFCFALPWLRAWQRPNAGKIRLAGFEKTFFSLKGAFAEGGRRFETPKYGEISLFGAFWNLLAKNSLLVSPIWFLTERLCMKIKDL